MERMETTLVNNILDALECARAALALMPPLPPNVKPVHFRILNAIYKIADATGSSRLSDISKECGLLPPNATKAINEMVDLDILEKFTSGGDRRVVWVRTTELGQQYMQQHVLPVMEGLEKEFSQINEIDCLIMIDTVHKINQTMQAVYRK